MVFYHVEQHLPRLLIAFLESQLRFVVGNPESNFPDINEMNAPMNPPLRIICEYLHKYMVKLQERNSI